LDYRFASAGLSTANLLQALEDYLPILLGLVKEGEELLPFTWSVFVLIGSQSCRPDGFSLQNVQVIC
jgi:hypothetical protein